MKRRTHILIACLVIGFLVTLNLATQRKSEANWKQVISKPTITTPLQVTAVAGISYVLSIISNPK